MSRCAIRPCRNWDRAGLVQVGGSDVHLCEWHERRWEEHRSTVPVPEYPPPEGLLAWRKRTFDAWVQERNARAPSRTTTTPNRKRKQ